MMIKNSKIMRDRLASIDAHFAKLGLLLRLLPLLLPLLLLLLLLVELRHLLLA